MQTVRTALIENRKPFHVFAGTGPSLDWLQAECHAGGLDNRVRFAGWIEPDRTPDRYNAADIVVMASRSEGMAGAYLEALACGRALITNDVPAARELLADREAGLLFPTGNIDALTKMMLLAAGDSDLRARLGANGRTLVEERHDFRQVVERYGAFLDAASAHASTG